MGIEGSQFCTNPLPAFPCSWSTWVTSPLEHPLRNSRLSLTQAQLTCGCPPTFVPFKPVVSTDTPYPDHPSLALPPCFHPWHQMTLISWKGGLRVQAPGAGRGAELVEMGVPVGPRAALTLLRSLARPACSWEVWKVSLWTLSHWGGGRPTNLCKWSRTCALGVDSRAAAGSPSPFLLDS